MVCLLVSIGTAALQRCCVRACLFKKPIFSTIDDGADVVVDGAAVERLAAVLGALDFVHAQEVPKSPAAGVQAAGNF